MNGLFRNANAAIWARLIGPFLGSLLLGGALIWLGVSWHNEFIKALGDAFVIAGVIGLCLELFAANRIIEHASQHVAERMTGYGLPEAARAVIHDLVHNTRRVCRDYRRTYRIERCPTRPGYVIVRCTLSYRVVNNGRGKESYRPNLCEEDSANPKFEALQFGDDVFMPQTIKSKTEKTTVSFWPDKTVQISGSDANTPADLLRPDQQCSVRWSYSLELPDYYSDVTAFGGVVIYPMIELLSKPDDLEFWADPDNSCKPVGDTWTYERAFVRGQHIRVRWRPNQSSQLTIGPTAKPSRQ